jgi:hypothetical protein
MIGKRGKLVCGLSILVLACASAPAPSAADEDVCKPVEVAEATKCVQDQLAPLRDAKTYNETTTVADNGDETRTVTFVFEPKCLRDPTPCRIASRSVTALVACKTATATCP